MTIIVGRLTGDALVKTIEEGKTVVNFTIVVNDYFKPKGSEEPIEYTEFFQCAYWYTSAIATSLKKGALVEAGGRLYASAYMAGQEIRPQINLQVQHVKVHAFAKSNPDATGSNTSESASSTETTSPAKNQSGKNRSRPVKTKPGQTEVVQQEAFTSEEPTGDLPF